MGHSRPLFLLFSFFLIITIGKMFWKLLMAEFEPGPLVSEATPLPTVPQPLAIGNILHKLLHIRQTEESWVRAFTIIPLKLLLQFFENSSDFKFVFFFNKMAEYKVLNRRHFIKKTFWVNGDSLKVISCGDISPKCHSINRLFHEINKLWRDPQKHPFLHT